MRYFKVLDDNNYITAIGVGDGGVQIDLFELLESKLNERLNEMIGSEAFANKILEIIEAKGFTLA